MIGKIRLIYNTLRYHQIRQIYFRIFYLLRNESNLRRNTYRLAALNSELITLRLKPPIPRNKSFYGPDTFRFLNLKKNFYGQIDWNYHAYGKLWTYNLNYFDFLNQTAISKEDGLSLIYKFIDSERDLIDGKEAYPTSLRIINWLKFLSRYGIQDQKINSFMVCDLHNLSQNVEYHLMANHVLENAMALTAGGYCLQQQDIYEKGLKLLLTELDEQLSDDGGHYEKCPMYHQVLLDRLLDIINILGVNSNPALRKAAKLMLSWLDTLTFSDGTIPYFSDSAPGVAPSTDQLKLYAGTLGISPEKISLSASGYRKLISDHYELVIDGGNIGPEYQAGHGHSDAGSFVLHVNGRPCLIDTGTSTYDASPRRAYERGVQSHNTTHPEGIEPSELWGSFRIARRETVNITKESPHHIEVTRNIPFREGYKLTRSFLTNGNSIVIRDHSTFKGNNKSYLHFAPGLEIRQTNKGLSTPNFDLNLENATHYHLEDCQVAGGFNVLESTKKLNIDFSEHMSITIKVKNRG